MDKDEIFQIHYHDRPNWFHTTIAPVSVIGTDGSDFIEKT